MADFDPKAKAEEMVRVQRSELTPGIVWWYVVIGADGEVDALQTERQALALAEMLRAAIETALREAHAAGKLEVAEAAVAHSSRSRHHPYAFETAWRCMVVALGADAARERMEEVRRG